MDEIQKRLFSMQDAGYKEFTGNLCPGYDPDNMIGVRLPQIKVLAKELKGTPEAERFMDELPHRYFEEYHLHMFLIEGIRDYDECLRRIKAILPYIDNWSVCDHSTPVALKKHPEKLWDEACAWIDDGRTYIVRYGIKRLMDVYLDGNFMPSCLQKVAAVRSEEYYVKMMVAWYFATALAKQYEAAVGFIESYRLDEWTHNKAIQKSVESFRVTDEHKAYLRSLRVPRSR